MGLGTPLGLFLLLSFPPVSEDVTLSSAVQVPVGAGRVLVLEKPEDFLETKSIATCVGLAGFHRETGEAFLFHFLFQDQDPAGSMPRAIKAWNEIESTIQNPLSDFEISIVGGSFGAESFARELLAYFFANEIFHRDQVSVDFGGDSIIRDIVITKRGTRILRSQPLALTR